MKKVVLKSINHKGASQIGIYKEYNEQFITLIKTFNNVRWSQTHRCFYTINNSTNYKALYQFLRGHKFYVDYSNFKVAAATVPDPVIAVSKNPLYDEQFLAFKKYLAGKRYSKSTINTYLHFASMFLKFIEVKPINSLTEEDVRLFIEEKIPEKNYSISTHRQLVSALKQLFSLYNHSVVLDQLSRPKKTKYVPVVLNQLELIELLKVTVNLKHRCILAMLYSCGMRVGEALDLEIRDIDLERKQVLIRNGKGRKDRYVGIASSSIPLLMNYTSSYRPKTYLFENKAGVKYSASSVRAFLKRNCKKAKITKHVTPHTLRHSYATHLVENGTGIAHIQRLLGHAKPETTMLYTHIANVDLVKIENPLDVAVDRVRQKDKDYKNMRLSGK